MRVVALQIAITKQCVEFTPVYWLCGSAFGGWPPVFDGSPHGS